MKFDEEIIHDEKQYVYLYQRFGRIHLGWAECDKERFEELMELPNFNLRRLEVSKEEVKYGKRKEA